MEKRHFRSRKANVDATGLLRLSGASLISVMQSADLRNRYHSPLFRRFHCPGLRGVFAQGQMRTGPLIVGKIIVQRSPQRSLIPHDHVVQALASDGAHQPLRKGILPGGSRRSKHFLDSHIVGHGREVCSVDGISIPQQISGCLVPGKRFPHLLHGPLLRGMFRHPEVHYPASLMRQHDKDEQDPEGRRWHGEKIDGCGLRQMICQEGSPGLGRGFAGPRQMPGHGGLRHGNTQLEQFTVNAGCTPQGVGLAHAPN